MSCVCAVACGGEMALGVCIPPVLSTFFFFPLRLNSSTSPPLSRRTTQFTNLRGGERRVSVYEEAPGFRPGPRTIYKPYYYRVMTSLAPHFLTAQAVSRWV